MFLIHSALNGADSAFHSVTFSASMCACKIGTSADWFLPIVIFCLILYSKKSPADLPSASEPCFSASDGDRSGPKSSTVGASASYLHRLVRRSQVQRGVDLIVATNAKVDIRQVESSESLWHSQNCGVSRLNIVEAVAALGIGGSHLRDARLLVANRNSRAADRRSRRIFHDAVEAGGGVRSPGCGRAAPATWHNVRASPRATAA